MRKPRRTFRKRLKASVKKVPANRRAVVIQRIESVVIDEDDTENETGLVDSQA